MPPSATETAAAKQVEDPKAKDLPSKEQSKEAVYADDFPPLDEALPEVRTDHKEPLKTTGVLDQFEHFEVTPVIGREYPTLDLKELLRAPNSDELLRDLAITSEQCLHQETHLLY